VVPRHVFFSLRPTRYSVSAHATPDPVNIWS
jgi:hypothetical protein